MIGCCKRRWGAATAAVALLVGGCSAQADGDAGLTVMVSFAPLAFVTERISGGEEQVVNLTPAGADPHSTELSPSKFGELQEADLVVYLSGFQPATDDAVDLLDDVPTVDTAEAAQVDIDGGSAPPDADHDPHFWLDPMRLAHAGHQVADELADIDPDRTEEFQHRANELEQELAELDREFADDLAPCAGDTVVTSHEAFGYLASRYDLEQVGISGVDPEIEPSPARLREVTGVIDETEVETIFFEVNASQEVAESLADDLGVRTDTLDPMERPADADYLTVMRANLEALANGLVCDG